LKLSSGSKNTVKNPDQSSKPTHGAEIIFRSK